MSRAYEELLEHAEVVSRNGTQASARCPVHDDRNPSLSIGVCDDGKGALIKCQAGCEWQSVLGRWGLPHEALFDDWWEGNGNGHRPIKASYSYEDRSGTELFQVVRYEPKDFRQRRSDGNGGWVWSLKGVQRVLFHLPQLVAGLEAQATVYVAEGEEDVLALEAEGAVATCNPMGAGKWHADYSEVLRGAQVRLVQDADQAGREHGRQVAASLHAVGATVELLEAREGKDARDHLKAGHGLEDFQAAQEAPPPWAQDVLRQPDPSRLRRVRWAWEGRVPLGKVSVLLGAEGIGKGSVEAWLAARLSHGELDGDLGEPVSLLIVGDEDALEDTWTPRLTAQGAAWERIYFPPEDVELTLSEPEDLERLASWVQRTGARAVFFDAIVDQLGRVDTNSTADIRRALRPLGRLARREGFAAVGAMHPRKAKASEFRELPSGSAQFNAVPRSTLWVTFHPEDSELPEPQRRRVLIRGKGNLSAVPTALEFRLEGRMVGTGGEAHTVVCASDWQDSEVTVEELLATPERDTKRAQVADQLLAAALEGPQTLADWARAIDRDPKDQSVRRALRELADRGLFEQRQDTRWERLRGGVSSVTPLRALTPDTPHNGTVVQFCLDGDGDPEEDQ